MPSKFKNLLLSMLSDTAHKNDIVVFSHLRWHFVTQRPQHIINRLSKKHKILFVEEPIYFEESDHGTSNLIKVNSNITVLQPKVLYNKLNTELAPLVKEQIEELGFNNPIFWFYSPAFVDILNWLDHSLVVYDCMDELTAFKGASNSLASQERILLAHADVVFTGGKSLYESKSRFHKNVHCFPSSVDHSHFKKALARSTRIPKDMSNIQKPVVGYYGVIDERIDLKLIEKLADRMPHVSFVMIGPVVKIDAGSLPKRDNLFYLGSKEYAELPNYLKSFDVCMMPFALNDATKFISPTKTLEYMTALKPIVSTPIYDVYREYQSEVCIAQNVEEFARSIVASIEESLTQSNARKSLQSQAVARTSWDKTAGYMDELMSEALAEKAALEYGTYAKPSLALN